MNFLTAFIFSLINLFCVFSGIYSYKKDKQTLFILLMFVYVVTLSILFGFAVKIDNIEPIEVYRGNTTLQITYQDSIPIDSVVVYKNK